MSFTIALAGNPNCGKTTLFNALTGASQRVGNWPGVTIDKKVGKIKGTDAQLVDLPGIYSLSPYSPEEMVSRNFIVNENPDAIINIVDATNLERNLFLTLQLIDMDKPLVVALNMMDEIEKQNDKIDVEKLSEGLGVPVVPISAKEKRNIDELISKVEGAASGKAEPKKIRYDDKIEYAVSEATKALQSITSVECSRFYAFKLIEGDSAVEELAPGSRQSISAVIDDLEKTYDDDADSIIADSRYKKISDIVGSAYTKAPRDEKGTLSDRVDRIVTNRILGLPIFIGIISLVYFIAMYDGDLGTSPGAWATGWLNDFIGEEIIPAVEQWCIDSGVSEPLIGLLCDGILTGVGAVIGFLPQMIILFICLVILEEVGYMARAAFVMDRIFRYFNLSGKSFIPLIVSTGCGVPGVMATRTIESEADRRITAMTCTFMPCGAKLPVISAIAGALAGSVWVAVFAYVMGIVMVIMSGIILRKFKKMAGTPSPFIMELPPYHMPGFVSSAKTVFDRSWAFVKKAGTIILLAMILVWFLKSFDWSFSFIGADQMDNSILASIGGVLNYLFLPLGWGDNWELPAASLTGLIAKEDLIGTLEQLIAEPFDMDISDALAAMLTPAAILSFFTFNMFCAPCFAAMGAIHRELGDWKSTGFAFLYQCLLAYFVSVIVYVIYSAIDGNLGNIEMYSIIFAIIDFAIIVYFLVVKDPLKPFRRDKVAE
ncbi:MAG: ferrous iron transport protein B [Candidatus Methanomethylophilaceae archaeon]|nr:ferrous iron transport protein B [Candidatus Methanomethylophilaceae archaeon]